MAKVMKKKWKIRIVPILIVLTSLVLLFLLGYFYLQTKIENIIVLGNERVSDQTIIDLAGIRDYPSFLLSNTSQMKRKILANPYIKEVSVRKKFYHTIEIEVEEYKILYQRAIDHKIIVEDGSELMSEDPIPGVPILLNYVPDTKQESFQKGLTETSDDILKQISEITYVPNDFDKDRFLLTMDDGNSVYLTLTKFNMINYYNEVLPQLEGKKGILFLDSGNHFQIME